MFFLMVGVPTAAGRLLKASSSCRFVFSLRMMDVYLVKKWFIDDLHVSAGAQ